MEKKPYSTKDFVTAVVLRIVGFDLIKMERKNGIATFFYNKTHPVNNEITIDAVLKAYWDRKLTYPVRNVLEAEKELKTRIYTLS